MTKIKYVLENILVTIVYCLGAHLGQQLAIDPGNVSAIWPPAGILVAWSFCRGPRIWPGVFVGAFIGNIVQYVDQSSSTSILLRSITAATMNGIGDTLSIVVATSIAKSIIKKDSPLEGKKDVMYFIVIIATLGSFSSALFGTSALWAADFLTTEKFLFAFMTWWIGDGASVLIITPFLLSICNEKVECIKEAPLERSINFIMMGISMLIIVTLPRGIHTSVVFILYLPMILWSVLRLGQTYSFFNLLAITIYIITLTINHKGPFIREQLTETLIQIDIYVIVLSLITLLFNAFSCEIKKYRDNLEEIIRKRTSKLVRAQKEAELANRAKSDFLAVMSHEIRTPLNSLLGMGELLKGTKLSETQQRFVRILNNSGEHLLTLINDILDLSKIEAGKLSLENTPLNLSQLVQEVIEIESNKASEKGISLYCKEVGLVPSLVRGDKIRLRQILINIINNAIKFTENGEVRVVVQALEKNFICFSITDTGVGIPDEKLQNIFNPFSQADETIARRFGGTGLGLSISLSLARLMDGKIEVTSKEGEGTCFKIMIPLIQVDNIEIQKIKKKVLKDEKSKGILKGIKILLVDDAEENRLLVETYLSGHLIEVDFAEDGKQGIKLFKENAYDIIFMDIQMPVLDGCEATKIIRDFEQKNKRPHTPIIAFTAHVIPEEIDKIRQAGCDDHLPKPIRQKQFIEKIKETCLKQNRQHSAIEKITEQSEYQDREVNLKVENQLLNNCSDGILITDKDFKITYVNQTLLKIFGYKSEELIGQSPDILNAEVVADKVQQKIYECMKDNIPWRGVILNKRKNGTHLYINTAIFPILDDKGSPYAYGGISRDVTNEVEYEKELIESKKQAELANRTKTTFLANISHELRTPLHSIIGFADSLMRTELTVDQQTQMGKIIHAGGRLERMIEDMIDISMMEGTDQFLNTKNFYIRELLLEVSQILRSKIADKDLNFQLDIGDEIAGQYHGDDERLKQVLIHILDNSVKFTQRGSITLRVNIKGKHQKNNVFEFIIEDTGIGISEKTQEIIFSPYTQGDDSTKKQYRGAGLGLTIAKKIANAMGGDIVVDSSSKNGTKIIMTILLESR